MNYNYYNKMLEETLSTYHIKENLPLILSGNNINI